MLKGPVQEHVLVLVVPTLQMLSIIGLSLIQVSCSPETPPSLKNPIVKNVKFVAPSGNDVRAPLSPRPSPTMPVNMLKKDDIYHVESCDVQSFTTGTVAEIM